MAIEYSKRGKTVDELAQADEKVQQTVRDILADIRTRKDEAVRELSEKFDKWSPDSFKLSDEQIAEIMASLPE